LGQLAVMQWRRLVIDDAQKLCRGSKGIEVGLDRIQAQRRWALALLPGPNGFLTVKNEERLRVRK